MGGNFNQLAKQYPHISSGQGEPPFIGINPGGFLT